MSVYTLTTVTSHHCLSIGKDLLIMTGRPSYQLTPGTTKHRIAVLNLIVWPIVGLICIIVGTWRTYITWLDLILLIGLWQATGAGITVGYHRMLTHEGFKTYWPIRATFLALGSMAFESGCIMWKVIHLIHHKRSDKEGDPHSPVLGGLYEAHMGWLFKGSSEEILHLYDHLKPRDLMGTFFDRTFPLWCLISLSLPFVIGGFLGGTAGVWDWTAAWRALIWGGLIRIGLTNHMTWAVNSICHMFGSRMFDVDDHSMNNWFVALLTGGEGFHNNHHAFPRSPWHGLMWRHFDSSWYIIWILWKLHLVWGLEKTLPENWRTDLRYVG